MTENQSLEFEILGCAVRTKAGEQGKVEAKKAIEIARKNFPRISFDLIYARPEQTAQAWAKEIVRRQALSYLQKQVRSERKVKPVQPDLLEQITRAFAEDNSEVSRVEQEASALRICINQLSRSERVLLQMRYAQQRQAFPG